MKGSTDTIIIGAGPYGLSIAAHLAAAGGAFTIVGTPMNSWIQHMPEGMMLKSAGLSSTLSDPGSILTLERFCRDQTIPYQHMGLPIALDTFTAYGLAFQKRFVPDVIDARVIRVAPTTRGFQVTLDTGAVLAARKVVVAVGLEYFKNMPDELADLPADLCTHSGDARNLKQFRGRSVAVVGGGSSAVDIAVLLHEAGSDVRLVARRKRLEFNADERYPRPLFDRVRQPMTGVGPGWKNLVTADVMPWIYPYLPDSFKLRTVQQTLGPAAGWFMKDKIKAVPLLLGRHILAATATADGVALTLQAPDGTREALEVDHLIASTGYKSDVRRLGFLGDLADRIAVVGSAPRLSSGFESSVPGLYFVGPVSAASAGSIMRFSLGAGFTARRIVRHLRPVSQAA